MLEKIKEKWEEILLHIKEEHELSDVSFKTWLLPTEVYSMKGDTVQILVPDIHFLGYMQKKYGFLITVAIGIGLVTPPVGMCIYVACDLMDTTVGEVFPTLVPFIAATFVCIALMVAFPQLILLPTYLMA